MAGQTFNKIRIFQKFYELGISMGDMPGKEKDATYLQFLPRTDTI